jgi:iron complex outermembrane receptor protein
MTFVHRSIVSSAVAEVLKRSGKHVGLCAVTATLGVTGIAVGQESSTGLEEVTVTATRTADTVNRVPLSIQAVTQDNLDRQGIKTAADLVRAVPGLNTVGNPGGSQQTFSIRGIVGGAGAATTSVYLDDTNLTKRSNSGVNQNNGVITPLLYDLARVEVLKGPQGTLFGGSSQGGTVRFITPLPSVTDYSGTARAELSTMGSRSETGNEVAAAFGGPIINDKLGFRISGIRRQSGGWIDTVSAYDGSTLREDSNGATEWAGRASLLWQASENFSVQLAAYHVDNKAEGGANTQTAVFLPNQQLAPASTTFTTQTRCITNATRTAPLAQPNANGGAAFIPTSVAPGANGLCPANTVFQRNGVTYGPFRTGRDVTLALNRQGVVGATSESDVFALTLDWEVANLNLKSITSYLGDEGTSNTVGGEEWVSTAPGAGQRTTLDTTRTGFPLFQPLLDSPVIGDGNAGFFDALNNRHGISQEFRAVSNTGSRLSWVGGVYFSKSSTDINYIYRTDPTVMDAALRLMYGDMSGPGTNQSEGTARYSVVNDGGFQANLRADIEDKESAAFVEANYWIVPEKLRVTAGVRYSKVELDYNQLNYGQFSGRLATSNGSLTTGSSSEEPVTPKVGVQYNFTDDKMVYASASKGFRAGGVSSQVSQTICQTALDNLGIAATDIPPAFGPDTVWSYEIGSKFRLFDRLQINLAAFRIDWKDVQVTTTLTCGQGFTANGGKARSEGAEMSVEYVPLDDLRLYLNASYVDAHYVDPVTGPVGQNAVVAPVPSFNAGDKFNVPPFTMSAGAQYDLTLTDNIDSYVRLDGTYQNNYIAGATFGSSGFAANYFTRINPSRMLLNLRAGMKLNESLDVNLFVQNLLGEDKLIGGINSFSDGRGCTPPAGQAASATCANYGTYSPFVEQAYETPRRYGLQVNYSF